MISKDLVRANCIRILELIDSENIETRDIKGDVYDWVRNNNNIELRQRLKMLRKDSIMLEKEL